MFIIYGFVQRNHTLKHVGENHTMNMNMDLFVRFQVEHAVLDSVIFFFVRT
jgi:hypothetical protein